MPQRKRLSLVFCRAGAHTIAFESRLIQSVEPLGTFVPEHHLAEILGLATVPPTEVASAGQCLHFHAETRMPPCRVDGAVELREIAYHQIHPLPALIASCCRVAGARAIIQESENSPCVLICCPPF